MTDPKIQFAKFIATVDQLTQSAKELINQMIDDPDDDMSCLANMIEAFSQLAKIEVESRTEGQLRSMAKFALVGIGSVLRSICEDEIATDKEDDNGSAA